MVFVMKFFYLFSFIFAINFLSVKCVYNKNCSRTCTAEKAWLKDFKTTLTGPSVPVDFDNTFAEAVTFTPATPILFTFKKTAPLYYVKKSNFFAVYFNADIGRGIDFAKITGGFLPAGKEYGFWAAYIIIAPSYATSIGTSYGNSGNPHTGSPIEVAIFYLRADLEPQPTADPYYPNSDTDPDTWIIFVLTIGVTGVIDNPSAAPLVADITTAGATGTAATTVEKVFGAFFAQIEAADSVFYVPAESGSSNNAIAVYLDVSPTLTISYAQWQEFAKQKNSDGEPFTYVDKFVPMYDCLPIGQLSGVQVKAE